MAFRQTFTVAAGHHDRAHCPVQAVLGTAQVPDSSRLRLAAGGRPIPCQAGRQGDQVVLTWILDRLPAGAEREFELACVDRPAPEPHGVELRNEEDDGRVAVRVDGELLTHYYYHTRFPRPFLHPLSGPGGGSVTRDFPMPSGPADETQDHQHHRSVWTAWGRLNGTDNWSEEAGHARQEHRRFDVLHGGPVFGQLTAVNVWMGPDGSQTCEERRTLRFYRLPAELRMIDYEVTFASVAGPLEFGDTKEGGILSVRVASVLDVPRGGTIRNSFGGVNEAETWGKRAHWCDYSGTVAGRRAGIAILDHPANFRHPTYWHVRDYGLMTANPFGLSHFLEDPSRDGSYTLAEGAELTFRYRLLVHAGDAAESRVSDRYLDFVHPPSPASR